MQGSNVPFAKRIARLAGWAGFAVGIIVAGGCDPVVRSGLGTDVSAEQELRLLHSRWGSDGEFALRFSGPVDPSSVGGRSILMISDGDVVRCRVQVRGDQVRLAPLPGRRPLGAEAVVVRIEGSPSPRAVRSMTGRPLAERVEITAGGRPTVATDLAAPVLESSRPPHGAVDVAATSDIVLHFSEPLDRASVRSERAFRVTVNGHPVPFRSRLATDRSTVLIRPVEALPSGATVEVSPTSFLLDAVGNPAEAAPPIRFTVAATALREVVEEFSNTEMLDPSGTSSTWCGLREPGYLVWGSGRRILGPTLIDRPSGDLGERSRVRFQVLLSPEDEFSTDAFASSVRLHFSVDAGARPYIETATIEAGVSDLDRVGPSFEGNRARSALDVVGTVPAESGLTIVPDDDGLGVAEILFPEPLALPRGETVLLDVELTVTPGARLAVVPGGAGLALVEGTTRSRPLPAMQLLVTGGVPQARSLWYDSGSAAPVWQRQTVTAPEDHAGVRTVIEFQSAPLASDGGIDVERASEWDALLDDLPPYRFVRFRVRFDGFPFDGEFPRVDSIVMPYETR